MVANLFIFFKAPLYFENIFIKNLLLFVIVRFFDKKILTFYVNIPGFSVASRTRVFPRI